MQLPRIYLYVLNAVLFVLGSLCPQALATLPGSSGGSFSVDNSGAARYEVPILVPPGTKVMQPELSLVYTSRGGNGMVGLGWSLKGLPSISRCPSGLKTDEGYQGGIHHDVTDGYCLGNQRLIAVDGIYGVDGTEYRTEVESYAKIISHGYAHDDIGTTSPSWFEVFTKDGKRYIYGNSPDSRTTPMGVITVHSWLLSRVEDRRGNYYSITYSEEPETWHLPILIAYTGNEGMGVTPAFDVTFSYRQRPDNRTRFIAGGRYPLHALLDTITTSANGEVARTYKLEYEQGGLSRRSRLVMLQECGN